MYDELNSWRKVGEALGVSPALAWRYAKTDYLPKDPELLKALDQPVRILIRQIRKPDGTFGRG